MKSGVIDIMALQKYRRFISSARRSPAFWARVAVRDFTEALVVRLGNKPQAALAEAAGVSPAYITKVLRGDENLTVATMAKLALAVGGKVRIHIADLHAQTRMFDYYTSTAVSAAPGASNVQVTPVNRASGSVVTA
jgi:hypothetical protein